LRRRGFPITAVAVSDSHDAGSPDGATESPIGTGRTVVRADELSEEGIRRGIRAGHAYVKIFGAASPDLRLDARAPDGTTATMGDAMRSTRARVTARVLRGRGMQLIVMRDGSPIETVPVAGDDFRHAFDADGRGDYRIQVQQGASIQSLSNPITLGRAPRAAAVAPRGGGARSAIRLKVRPRRVRVGQRKRFRFVARTRGGAPLSGVKVRFGRKRAWNDSRGIARIRIRFHKPRRARAKATARGYKSGAGRVKVLRRRR